MSITDNDIKKAIANDEQAFKHIYNETIKIAYFVTKRYIKNDAEAEDVLQESYIAVYSNLSNFKSGNFQGWVDTIVSNRCKNYLRKKNPILFTEMEDDDGNIPEFEDDRMDFKPEEQVDYNETKTLIMQIIDSLPVDQKMCVLMYYYEQMSIKDIATACECSENTVKSRLNYARKFIKNKVEELEKKGTKLHCIAIMPFILWLFRQEAYAQVVPDSIATYHSNSNNIRGTKNMNKLMIKIAIGTVAAVAAISVSIGIFQNKETSKSQDNNSTIVNASEYKEMNNNADFIGSYVIEYRSLSIVQSEVGGVELVIDKYDGNTISGSINEYESSPGNGRGKLIINFKDLPVVDDKVSLKGLVTAGNEEYDGSITITNECIYLTIYPQSECEGMVCKHDNVALYLDNSKDFVADNNATGADKFCNKFHVDGFSYSDITASVFSGDIENVGSDDNFIYVEYADNVRVLYKGGLGDTVEYPCEYNGKPIREITMQTGFTSGYNGTFATAEDLAAVKKVIIPDTVWLIGAEAFANMGITDIQFGKNVVDIGAWAFKKCNSLEEFTIPKSVIYVGPEFISGSNNIKKVNIYNTYLDFSKNAFDGAVISNFTSIK